MGRDRAQRARVHLSVHTLMETRIGDVSCDSRPLAWRVEVCSDSTEPKFAKTFRKTPVSFLCKLHAMTLWSYALPARRRPLARLLRLPTTHSHAAPTTTDHGTTTSQAAPILETSSDQRVRFPSQSAAEASRARLRRASSAASRASSAEPSLSLPLSLPLPLPLPLLPLAARGSG